MNTIKVEQGKEANLHYKIIISVFLKILFIYLLRLYQSQKCDKLIHQFPQPAR